MSNRILYITAAVGFLLLLLFFVLRKSGDALPDAVTSASPPYQFDGYSGQEFHTDAEHPVILQSVVIRFESALLSPKRQMRKNFSGAERYSDIVCSTVRVYGLVDTERYYRFENIVKRDQNYIKDINYLFQTGGWLKIRWEGVLVKDLLEETGVDIRAAAVRFHGKDGHSVVFPLWYVYDKSIILAYKANNALLPLEHGFPFLLVSEEGWEYSWERGVMGIEVVPCEERCPLGALLNRGRSVIFDASIFS
ncbi:MAG: molybdopterin-dependent oxidoreductase [Candidatus Omnitrophica bacterium]|nr:molybdopterin-dependent oxidoreductase [Candidatus Omnitrophota bacterium]